MIGWRLVYGPRIIIDAPDEFIQHNMLWFGAYEPAVADVLITLLDPGDLFLDVGAHIGQHALIMGGRGVIVHVFEPVPQLRRRIRANLRMNGIKENVIVFDAAISKENAEAEMYVAERIEEGSHSLVAGEHLEAGGIIKVKTISLDAHSRHIGRRPSAIKIDVEGAESLVLDGARETLTASDAPIVVVETGDRRACQLGETSVSVLGRLFDCGYRVFRMEEYPSRLIEVSESTVIGDVVNYAAIPNGHPKTKMLLARLGA
jgi:FkbM family methyltransferase